MAIVTRGDRQNDFFSLALILIGVALFLDGSGRLTGIQQFSYRHPGPRGIHQVEKYDEAFFESTAGIVLVIGGAAAGISAALAHRRRGLPVT